MAFDLLTPDELVAEYEISVQNVQVGEVLGEETYKELQRDYARLAQVKAELLRRLTAGTIGRA